MGQAKNRGTHAERVVAAVAKQAAHQQNFVFVWDDSEIGRQELDRFLTKGPPHFANTLRPKLEALRAMHPRYIAFFGTLAYSGGLSCAAMDDHDLLDGVLPRLVERSLERGGLCSFSIAVDPQRRVAIEQRLAELQPVMGKDGHVTVPPLLRELAEKAAAQLMPPLYGGHVLPFAHVALSETFVERVQRQLHIAGEAWREAGDENLAIATQTPHAERLQDGRLILYTVLPDQRDLEIEVPIAEWTTTAKQLGQMAGWMDGIPPRLSHPTALQGGELVEEVRIRADAMPEYGAFCASSLSAWLAENPDGLKRLMESDRMPILHEVMADGSLEAVAISPLGDISLLNIAADHWERA